MSIKNPLTPSGIILTTYFYSGTLRTFQHICNSYCQHYSSSQNVDRTRDIITPHTNVPFGPTLSRTLYSYTTRIHSLLLSLHTAKSYNVGALCQFHPLMLVCLHSLAIHSPYSLGSISVEPTISEGERP